MTSTEYLKSIKWHRGKTVTLLKNWPGKTGFEQVSFRRCKTLAEAAAKLDGVFASADPEKKESFEFPKAKGKTKVLGLGPAAPTE